MPKKILLVDFDSESLNSLSRFIKTRAFKSSRPPTAWPDFRNSRKKA